MWSVIVSIIHTMSSCFSGERARGGGGYSVWKRVPTAVRPLRSGGCRDPRWLKRGGCPLIILYSRGAVRVFASNI